jgi:hypothetical protein
MTILAGQCAQDKQSSLLTQPADALPTNYANCGNKTVCSRRVTEAVTAGETAPVECNHNTPA